MVVDAGDSGGLSIYTGYSMHAVMTSPPDVSRCCRMLAIVAGLFVYRLQYTCSDDISLDVSHWWTIQATCHTVLVPAPSYRA